jgi:Protein of unknown function (DUF2860)
MLMKYIKGMLIVTAVLFAANLAFALDPIPKESGFSGYIGPGIGAVKYKGNMIAGINKVNYDFGEATTTTLTGEAESNTQGIGLLNAEIGYNFANSRTRVFIGSTLEDFIQFDYGQQLGVRQEIGNLGVVSAGFLFSNLPITVWKDPYITNTPRQDTNRDSTGARFVWGKILNTGFQLQLDFRTIDIDEEQSGTSLGLTAAQRQQLDRNGDLFKGQLQYRFKVAPKQFLAPAFLYTVNDRDGDAMSSDVYAFKLTYLYFGETVSFAGNALFGRADYDAANPIPDFNNQTQEDDHYGFTGTLFYKNPFGWEWFGSDKISFFGTVAYYTADSNIDFYTTELTMGVLGIMYRF